MKQRNSTIDLVKFILALFVVAIHVRPFSGQVAFFYDDVIARMANPVFFILSSYLFFKKANESNLSQGQLKKYIVRISIMYFLWIIILMPIIYIRTQETASILNRNVFSCLLQNIFLRGPYGAMWFLTALLWAMPLTYLFAKHGALKLALGISFFLNLIAICMTEFPNIFAQMPFFKIFDVFISHTFIWYANGLTFGFFYCCLGCLLAKRFGESVCGANKALLVALFAVLPLFIAEPYVFNGLGLGSGYGISLMAIPFSYLFVAAIIEKPLKVTDRQQNRLAFLQKTSILIFLIHYPVMELIEAKVDINSTTEYVLVIAISFILSAIIVGLSKIENMKFLKYLY